MNLKKITPKLIQIAQRVADGSPVRELLAESGLAATAMAACEASVNGYICTLTLTLIDSESAEKVTSQGLGSGSDIFHAQRAAEDAAWSLLFGARRSNGNDKPIGLSDKAWGTFWASMKNIDLDEPQVRLLAAEYFKVETVKTLKDHIHDQRNLNKFLSYCNKAKENEQAAG